MLSSLHHPGAPGGAAVYLAADDYLLVNGVGTHGVSDIRRRRRRSEETLAVRVAGHRSERHPDIQYANLKVVSCLDVCGVC